MAITYLHHTHPALPHYDASAWTFVAGALSTVDRDCGFVGRNLFHHITDTHVLHHLFPLVSPPHSWAERRIGRSAELPTLIPNRGRITFYHAAEATEAIKPILGHLYRSESGWLMHDLWRTFRACAELKADPLANGVYHW